MNFAKYIRNVSRVISTSSTTMSRTTTTSDNPTRRGGRCQLERRRGQRVGVEEMEEKKLENRIEICFIITRKRREREKIPNRFPLCVFWFFSSVNLISSSPSFPFPIERLFSCDEEQLIIIINDIIIVWLLPHQKRCPNTFTNENDRSKKKKRKEEKNQAHTKFSTLRQSRW